MIITTDTVMKIAQPSRDYPRKRVAELIGDGVTPQELAALDVPVTELLWWVISVLLGERERELRLFTCDCAERVLARERDAGREPDPRSWAVVEVARRYADGAATDAELDDAGADARAATRVKYRVGRAAEAAAKVAALAAASADSLCELAGDAAELSALWFYLGAVRDYDAEYAEREWQFARVLEYADEHCQ